MGKKKEQAHTNILNSMRWCNGFACRYYDCEHHPNNIPKKYRNSAFRYVDSSNFSHCPRWEAIDARNNEKKRKEQENEDNDL